MLRINKIDDKNIRIQQDNSDVNAAAVFFASASENGMITISPKNPGAHKSFSDSLENIEINGVSGSDYTLQDAIIELNSFIGNFNSGGSSSENNGNNIDIMEFRPNMWESDTEYDFGDGLFGMKFSGIGTGFDTILHVFPYDINIIEWNGSALLNGLLVHLGFQRDNLQTYVVIELEKLTGTLRMFRNGLSSAGGNTWFFNFWIKYTKI